MSERWPFSRNDDILYRKQAMSLAEMEAFKEMAEKPHEEPGSSSSAVLHRHLHHNFVPVLRGEGSYLVLQDGRRILDGSGGAAVVCIGHGDQRVVNAAMKQMAEVAYCATIFYTTNVCEQLCRFLVDSTKGQMARAYLVSSGGST